MAWEVQKLRLSCLALWAEQVNILCVQSAEHHRELWILLEKIHFALPKSILHLVGLSDS